MLDLYSMNEQELLDLATTKEWMWKLLQNPKAQQDYESALDFERFNYIQQEYTDEYELHTWSCSDIRPVQLLDPHPYPAAEYVEHRLSRLNADGTGRIKIPGPLWIDLWVAASQAIDLADTHHSFIEGFSSTGFYDVGIEVHTGS